MIFYTDMNRKMGKNGKGMMVKESHKKVRRLGESGVI